MLEKIKSVNDIKKAEGKSVFVTVDFNISLSDGKITNDTRIKKALPTISYLRNIGAKIILASHLGRPDGIDAKLSLSQVAKRLSQLARSDVELIENFWKKSALLKVKKIKKDKLILLENIRFHRGEKVNDEKLAKHLSRMADFFVNDAFGASHRVHASIVGIPQHLPSYAGFLLAREIKILNSFLEKPQRPFVVVIGGAKTPEKIRVIEKLIKIADTILLGGAIANTFLAAWGFGMGKSKVDYEMIEMARVVFWQTTRSHSALILPEDVVTADKNNIEKNRVVKYNRVPEDQVIYDIGPRTRKLYTKIIKMAKTVIWNGPMGFFEKKRFVRGTEDILKAVSSSKAKSIVGGGDTLSTINKQQYLENIFHISTGGGAMLEFIEKGTLPGIEVLRN